MATYRAMVRQNTKNPVVNILFRVRERNIDISYNTGIKIKANSFDNSKERIKGSDLNAFDKHQITEELQQIRGLLPNALLNLLNSGEEVNSNNFAEEVNRLRFPARYVKNTTSFEYVYKEFYNSHINVSVYRKRHYKLVESAINRFITYKRHSDRHYRFDCEKVDKKDIEDFITFLRREHIIKKEYPEDYKGYRYANQKKAENTISTDLQVLRSIFKFAFDREITTHYVFKDFEIPKEVYGDPYFLTIEERDTIYTTKYSKEIYNFYRDVFIFQCFIGCRNEDIWRLTQENIKGDFIEYIAIKQIGHSGRTIRVPLSDTAKDIIKRNKSDKTNKLFSKYCEYKYNKMLKKIFTEAGITRLVTIKVDTSYVQRPLNEIASSHLARRTFIGNLYNKVKDPNLIASMSGHKEGSRAFSRYRTIDDNIKQDLIKLIE